MNTIKDKKLWFAVMCGRQTTAPSVLPVSSGLVFAMGAAMLMAFLSLAVCMLIAVSPEAGAFSLAGVIISSRPVTNMIKKNVKSGGLVTNEGDSPVQVQNIGDLAANNGSIFRRLLKSKPQMRTNAAGQQYMETNAQAQIRALRTNDLLRKDQWKELDAAMLEIAAVRLRPLELLRQRGLVRTLDGLGVLLSQYEKLSDMTDAEISMSGVARTQEDSVDVSLTSVPIPVISKDFRINVRRLLASQRGVNGMGSSEGIDATQIRTATRKVAEKMVEMLFTGYAGNLDGNTLKGLTNHADVNTYSSGGDWGTVGNIYDTVIAAITALQGDRMFGPYGMFVSNTQYLQMLTYISNVNQTALMRVMSIPGIQFVEPADQLTDGTAVIFQLTSDVIDIAIAQDMTVVEWDEQGGLTGQFKVMAAYAPRPKSDYDSRSGICYISGI